MGKNIFPLITNLSYIRFKQTTYIITIKTKYAMQFLHYRTNLPKEVMGFPDFAIPEQKKSYLTQAEILDFLNQYADKFNLMKYIQVQLYYESV